MFGKKENCYCPVCPISEGKLGARYSQEYFDARCSDCRATYYFRPNSSVPYKVLTDKEKKVIHGYCGPDGCICRS